MPATKCIPNEASKTLMAKNAANATSLLKAAAHERRFMILVHLLSGEKSVGELEELLSARQASVSQQLARLRQEGLVSRRRDGKVIYYSLADERSQKILDLIYGIFAQPEEPAHQN